MKVLFLYLDFPGLGGIESVTLLLANYLSDRSIKIEIMSANANAACDISALSKQVKLIRTPEPKDINSTTNKNFIKEYIKKNKIDFVINQGCVSKIKSSDLPSDCKLIQTLHGLPFWEIRSVPYIVSWEDVLKAPVLKKLSTFKKFLFNNIHPNRKYKRVYKDYKYYIENCDCFVTLCDGYSNILKSKFPEYTSRFKAIENPIVNKSQEDITKEKEVVFIGRLHKADKRVDRILKIWSKIENNNNEWKLRIVGDGLEYNNLTRLAQKLLLKRCIFQGYEQNPSIFQKKAKIIILTSNYEGLPMALLESMQVGTVPVAYNCSEGMELLIDNGKNGFLIPCFKQKEFENKLLELMNNESLWSNMSKQAIVKAQEFDIQIIGEKWIHLFDSMTTSK